MAWFKRYPTVIRRSVNRSFVRKLFLLAAIVTGNEFCGVIAQAQEVSVLSSIREPFAQEAEQNSIPEKSTPLLSSPVTPSAASQIQPAQYLVDPATDYQSASFDPFDPLIESDIGQNYSMMAYQSLASHYDDLATGPKQYADYAPEGFYPLDYQEAPGASLYTRLTPAPAISQDDFDRLVIRGPVPGSFMVPGTPTSIRLSGFVRMGANYDFQPVGTPDLFVTRTIPVPQTPGQNVNYSARPTRISLDTWTPTTHNDWVVHTFVQFDFLSGNPPAVGSSSNPRLRFAFVDYGYFRVGQDTTVFMDASVFPRTADFQGPNGIVNSRQGLGRITLPVSENVFVAAALEQPFSDITTNGLGTNVQDIPDFTTHLRYQRDLWHLQAAAIVRSIGYRPTGEEVDRRAGWGVNLTGSLLPWAILKGENPLRDTDPQPFTRSRVLLQFAVGSGIGRYIQDTSGIGLDGAVTANGGFETLGIRSMTASYEHWWAERWMTNVTYSNVQVDSSNAMPGSSFAGSDYVATSLWYVPVRNASIGIEYLWGRRENQNRESGTANRIQTVFQYNF